MDNEAVKNGFYQSVTHGQLKVEDVIIHIKAFLEEEPDAVYSLVIGTDSHEKSGRKDSKDISFVTSILIQPQGF